ncbi:CheR family methyltransferase [Thiorhodococcus fuscus]|uniref:protein-glutamate O-methyltransferase n=1 Tax=Thiorhodococcus fuscus TaxID=527200 RepID=A0ABW4YAJ9_9GAMM
MNLQAVQSFIKERLGLHLTEQSGDAWRAMLAKRIARVGADSADAYLERLRTDEDELQTLTSLLTINETYFYREPQHLDLLTERFCPELIARMQPGRPIRILSVGCSSGEEPYSILMALRERYGELADRLFDLNAGDVDQAALKRARAGIYNRFSFRTLSPALIERYFTSAEGSLRRIDEGIRRQITFQQLNLLAPEYPADLRGQDVLFFRNVSIYFDAQTREFVLRRLKSLLNPGGYLIVGISETLANDLGVLALRELDGVFFFANACADGPILQPSLESGLGPVTGAAVELASSDISNRRPNAVPEAGPAMLGDPPLRGDADRRESGVDPIRAVGEHPVFAQSLVETPIAAPPVGARAEVPVSTSAEAVYQEALALTQSERFDDALDRLAPLCAGLDSRIQDLTLLAHILLERGDRLAASAAVERALAIDPWSLDALLLLARIALGQADVAGAIGHLRRAIYHRPDAWQAHFRLAEIYREDGQSDLARREYRIVLHQLERLDMASPVQYGEHVDRVQDVVLLALPYSLRDLRLLCETRLSRLDAMQA